MCVRVPAFACSTPLNAGFEVNISEIKQERLNGCQFGVVKLVVSTGPKMTVHGVHLLSATNLG